MTIRTAATVAARDGGAVFEEQSVTLYDAFYDALGKDYEWESRRVLQLVRRAGMRRPQSLLDVACGTGRHLAAFARSVPRCVGTDIEPAFFGVAASRCPSAELVEADMVTLALGERFDVVTCLFSSIAYVRTVARLRRAVRAMAAHLNPGGVLAVEPWFQPEEWRVGEVHSLHLPGGESGAGNHATRMSRSDRRGDMSVLDFHYLVATREDGVSYFTERHELRLFTWDQYRGAFERAGLSYEVDEYGLFGRGLLVGRAP